MKKILVSQLQSRRRNFHWAWLMMTVPAVVGCGPTSSESEVSSATSGFKPAGESNKGIGSAPAARPGGATSNDIAVSKGDRVENAQKLEAAPTIPSFEPGKIDPAIASKSYSKLALPSTEDPKELIRFLAQSDSATRDLMTDGMKRSITPDIVIDRGMAIARFKLTASERLSKFATTDDERAVASIGKLEALSQMAGFKDVSATDELRIVAEELSKSQDPRVAQQAKSISLSTAAADFENGAIKSSELLDRSRSLLANPSVLTATSLKSLAQAITILDGHSEELAAIELARNVEEGFRDSVDPQLAMGAWQLAAQRIPETQNLLQLLANGASPPSAEDIRSAAESIMKQLPSPWTSIFLLQSATQVEYSGKPLLAKELFEVAGSQIENTRLPQLKDELLKNCEQFKRRIGALNKPLPLNDLVDTAGNPLDLSAYQGKVVLVDFWASWCGPCIAELPNIQAVFEAKHDQGFEVIGINLDEKRADLDAFLAERKLPWNTYVSSNPDQSGFSTPVATELGVAAIPFIVLIDRKGNVAGIHVRGRELENKVAELLAESGS